MKVSTVSVEPASYAWCPLKVLRRGSIPVEVLPGRGPVLYRDGVHYIRTRTPILYFPPDIPSLDILQIDPVILI